MWGRCRKAPAEPDFGREFAQFRDGLGVLRREGERVGHVATALTNFRTPFASRPVKPWVWIVVVWADGVKEFPIEDYPPWTYVAEMRSGYLDWNDGADPSRFGRYEVEWMPPQQAGDERARLGIRSSDF